MLIRIWQRLLAVGRPGPTHAHFINTPAAKNSPSLLGWSKCTAVFCFAARFIPDRKVRS